MVMKIQKIVDAIRFSIQRDWPDITNSKWLDVLKEIKDIFPEAIELEEPSFPEFPLMNFKESSWLKSKAILHADCNVKMLDKREYVACPIMVMERMNNSCIHKDTIFKIFHNVEVLIRSHESFPHKKMIDSRDPDPYDIFWNSMKDVLMVAWFLNHERNKCRVFVTRDKGVVCIYMAMKGKGAKVRYMPDVHDFINYYCYP